MVGVPSLTALSGRMKETSRINYNYLLLEFLIKTPIQTFAQRQWIKYEKELGFPIATVLSC